MKQISYPKIFCFLIFCCLFSNSCIIPYYVPDYSGKRIIDLSGIKLGVTTKEEMLLKFGSAFGSDQNEKLFTATYNLTTGHYGLVMGSPGGAYTVNDLVKKSITTAYIVEIEFDNNDVVKRCEVFKLPRD
jgi:hypothetical protein